MPDQRVPEVDLQLVSEELEAVPQVLSTVFVQGGLQIELENDVLLLSGSVDSEEEAQDGSSVLLATDAGYIELSDGDPLRYDFSDSTDDYVSLLKRMVVGDVEPERLADGEELELLTETGLLEGYISKALGELMTGWAVSKDDSVLDVAAGSGFLLEQAAESTNSSRLVGVEIHPSIARLARTRLGDVEGAEVVNEDFFDWGVSGRQELQGTPQDIEESGKFDVVIGDPPVRIARGEGMQSWAVGNEMSTAFVNKAVSHLKDGGRGAFLLPKSALKQGLLERLSENCGIHRVVELPAGLFDDANSIRLVLLTLIKEDRRMDVRKTGVAKFNRTELPENARGLLEQPLEDIVKNRHGRYDAEVVEVSHEDLEGENAARILSNPSIHSIITSDGFTELEEVSGVRVGRGVRTGNNEFFYFDEEKKESSDIDDRFFRPVIKNPSGETRKITSGDIDLYLLDLKPYTDKLNSQGVEISEDTVVEELERNGYEELADYIEQEPEGGNLGCPKFEIYHRGMFENPDLVISKRFDSPRCYRIEVDDVVFDPTVIGIQTENDQMRDSLARLLNTPLYEEILQTYADYLTLDWYRLNISSLCDVPIIGGALNQNLLDRTDPFFPPDDDNDLVRLNHVLIERCEDDSESQAVRQYLDSTDDYAWSWFMSRPELERFQDILEDDEERAQEFVFNRFDEDLLDQIRHTFENIDFFEERRELIDDLLMEFEEDHYRGFLAGIVPQFEGLLADLVEQMGGEIITEGHRTRFRMPGEKRDQVKNLNELISVFFDGVFSTFLDENVRERRNEIAHGAVVENSRELSIHFLISFYALCNASMSEYVNGVDRDQSVSSA